MIEVARVGKWLGRTVDLDGPAAGGSSSVTLLVTIDGEAAVLQAPPPGAKLATAHDLARQQRYLSAVAGSAVPVPEVIAFCDDEDVAGQPFLLTKRMPGVCLMVADLALDGAALSESAIDTLAALHGIDWRRAGLGVPEGSYLDRQVDRWSKQLSATPTAHRLGDLSGAANWLRSNRPRHEDSTIVHGDYGFHNLLVTERRIEAVLDWELATIGDPLVDLIGLIKSWGPGGLSPNPANAKVAQAPGAHSAEQMIDRYESLTGRDFRSQRRFYEAFSLYKSIGIFEGIHARSGATRFADEPPELVRRLNGAIAEES